MIWEYNRYLIYFINFIFYHGTKWYLSSLSWSRFFCVRVCMYHWLAFLVFLTPDFDTFLKWHHKTMVLFIVCRSVPTKSNANTVHRASSCVRCLLSTHHHTSWIMERSLNDRRTYTYYVRTLHIACAIRAFHLSPPYILLVEDRTPIFKIQW